jgi:threonine synthase
MHLAQPEGSSPIVEAFRTGSKQVRPVKPDTIAKSLAIGNPAAGPFALEVLAATGGTAVAALEEEVEEGIRLLAETEGIFTETAGGVVISGLRRLVNEGKIGRDEVTVAYVTGNGFKTIEVVEDNVRPVHSAPNLDSFEDAMEAHGA